MQLDKLCYVYVITSLDNLNICKIGIAGNVSERLKSLSACSPLPLMIMTSRQFKNRESAMRFESIFHKAWHSSRIHGEWFKANSFAVAKDLFYYADFLEENYGH